MPFRCNFCGKYHDTKHRLPEDHNCRGLTKWKKERIKQFRRGEAPISYEGAKKYFKRPESGKSKLKKKDTKENSYYKESELGNFSERETETDKLNKMNELERYEKIHSKNQKRKIKNTIEDKLPSLIFLSIIAMFFSSILSPFVLILLHQDMQLVIGNPRPLYFYDIEPSCIEFDDDIKSALDKLQGRTGVRFIRLPSPSALIIGGISYTCEGTLANHDAIGESASGYVGVSYFLIAWNKITIPQPDEETILHETLHSMSFGHTKNPASIMYPYHSGNSRIDTDIEDFIKREYNSNPLAYLNIIPLNLLYILIILLLIFLGFLSHLNKYIKQFHKEV